MPKEKLSERRASALKELTIGVALSAPALADLIALGLVEQPQPAAYPPRVSTLGLRELRRAAGEE